MDAGDLVLSARWVMQLLLVTALLIAAGTFSFRRNAPTRRAHALMSGLLLALLPVLLVQTSGWYWVIGLDGGPTWSLAHSISVPMWWLAVWIGVAGALTLRTCAGLILVRRWIRALPVANDARISRLVGELSRRLGIKRPVDVRLGGEPCSSSVGRPTVVLPDGAEEWSTNCLAAVLAHELVHIKRRDDVAMIGLKVVVHWYWFLPWAYLLERQFARAMEESCDDLASELLPSHQHYLDGVVGVVRALTPLSGWVARLKTNALTSALGNPLVTRISRFVDSREIELDTRALYWGLVISLGTSLMLTSVEVERAKASGMQPAFYARAMATVPVAEYTAPRVWATHERGVRGKYEPLPIYPGVALNRNIEGDVRVEYLVTRDGGVVRPRILDATPPGVFDEAVLRAVVRAEYPRYLGRDPPDGERRVLRRFRFRIDTKAP